MAFERINIDLESNNLLKELLDYSSLPYKLKNTAKLWCIGLRCMDTKKSVLLLPKEHLNELAPTKILHLFELDSNNPAPIYSFELNEDLTFYNQSDKELYETLDKDNYYDKVMECSDGIKYNLIPKRELSKDMLINIFKNVKEVSGHNIVNFDLPLLKLFDIIDYQVGYPILQGEDSTSDLKQTKFFENNVKITDTLIWSKLLNPDRVDKFGKHSVEAWGGRLGYPKISFHEFDKWSWKMGFYCDNDTLVGTEIALHLEEEASDWNHWDKAYSQEIKLIDDMVLQEHFGFNFDVELAKECIVDLDNKLQERADQVEPHLPPKPLNKGQTDLYTPPAKQILKNGKPNSFIQKFAEKHGATIVEEVFENVTSYYFCYKDKKYKLPFHEQIETNLPTSIKDNNPVKKFLMDNGWIPTEWAERDFSRNSKKQLLPYEKSEEAILKYVKETEQGLYTKDRLEFLNVKSTEQMKEYLLKQISIKPGRPVKGITSPKLRVGTSKDLCPNLIKMSKNITFIQAIAEYYTYKHRRNSISGTEEDEEGNPEKGFLSFVREDGRISTPADTMGAGTFRYTHRQVANISRVSSLYGGPMRSLFGCGFEEYLMQLGFDFASLEARVLAHYVYDFTNGVELGKTFLAERPNDVHCYSEDTEIFTMSGWKTFQDLSKNDRVCQWSDDSKFSFTSTSEIVSQNYSGKMLKLHDMIITPNHRIVLLDLNGKSFIKTYDQLDNNVFYQYMTIIDSEVVLRSFYKKDIEVIDYNGKIGCVSVPTGKVLVRRNGTKFISGNTINAQKLGISRDNAKAITYACMYGAAAPKLQKLLGLTPKEAEEMFEAYWKQVPALKELKEELTSFWESTGKEYIVGIDGRKLRARQAYSLINLLFQSAGAILAKWSLVRISEKLQEQNLLGNPFKDTEKDIKVWKMIAYHDEAQYAVSKQLIHTNSFFNKQVHEEYLEQVKTWEENGSVKADKPVNILEEAAKDFLEQNKTDEMLEQYSDIGHTDSGVFYVSLPNVLSKTIIKSIDEVVKDNSLKVDLGISWITGKNWKMCH